jgi:hypothetical protein
LTTTKTLLLMFLMVLMVATVQLGGAMQTLSQSAKQVNMNGSSVQAKPISWSMFSWLSQ